MATGIVFGLTPALQGRGAALTNALKDATRGATEGRRRAWVRNALVVAEIAFACVLVVGAGLLVRSLMRVLEVDMGFVPERAAAIRVDPDRRFENAEQRNAYYNEVLRRVKEIPGVESAGITDALPLGRNRTWGSPAKGVTYERGRFPLAFPRIVSDNYITAMGIPLRAGRDISPDDTPSGEPVMLVNETMARTLWPGQDPIGKFVLGPCAKERRVVGVVGDVRHLALEQASGNEMYIPLRQCADLPSADLVVRSSLPPEHMANAVRAALRPIAPNLPGNFRSLQQLVDKSVSPRSFLVLLLGGFAVFALVLASLGIYGLISYSVSQRTQEIGIRMALGASARDVQARIVMQTLSLAAIGMVLGTIVSWLAVRSAESLLFGVTPRDPGTFAGMLVVLTCVALIAGYVPARRASRVDPMVALRTE
jgi:predicted permease